MTEKAKRLEQTWKSFETAVIPAGASQSQRVAMRTAFYGGASACLYTLMTMLEAGEEATQADIEKVNELNAELTEFAESQVRP